MKNEIHPQYHAKAKVVCACGNTFTTGSTLAEMHVEICSNCHPFYTGKQNLIDTAGTIEKFRKKATKSSEMKTKRITKKLKTQA
ncbi:MAG TPA: 50S ribosomal protein L31 [Candidatus Binatia bacterium]|nr:50S ribosomal protein L31 [Candidatus Binatia bacterium]